MGKLATDANDGGMVAVYDEKAVRSRIRTLIKKKGVTQERLAEAIGVHFTSVSRVLNGKIPLDGEWVRRFARALNVDISELIGEPDPMPAARVVVVKGDVQAGQWALSWEWPEDDWFRVGVSDDPAFRHFALYGARTRGPSMDRRYPDGTILIFTEVAETGEDLVPGRRYIVERERADGQREATVKTLWRDPQNGSYLLVPESHDPRFQEPIPLEGADNDTIRIIGRVVGSYQRE